MENFVFPDEIKTKFMKMYELMNIFPILTGIPQKSCKRYFYSRAAASLMMVWVGIVVVVQQTIVS